MRKGLLVVALLMCAYPASAQTVDDLKQVIAIQQQQIDVLQKALNAKLGPQNVAGYVDLVEPGPPGQGVIVMEGWAFQCGTLRPEVQVKIDGLILGQILVTPIVRTDVTQAYSAYCAPLGGMLPDVGATALIDVSHFAAGSHTLALHLIAANGFAVDTNTVTFTK